MTTLNPDIGFINDLRSSGGEAIKKCFQCATCSSVCELSPDDHPYPRKEMIWAQWGLKDRLMSDPDVWLCHWCNDCSVHCPRGVKPGDVMAAIRSRMIQTYSRPNFVGKMLGQVKHLPLLLLVPTIFLAILISSLGTVDWNATVSYSAFFPHIPLQIFFTLATFLAAFGAIIGVLKFWTTLSKHGGPAKTSLVAAVIQFGKDFVAHASFRNCGANKARSYAHMSIVYGFGLLLIATTGAVYCAYISHTYPLGFWHPVKIVGNIGAILLTIGCFWVLSYRISDPERVGGGSYSDWLFLAVLGLVTLTGVAAEAGRFADITWFAYPIYFIHLVLVFFLLAYAPYSKFAHFIYRTVAMVHALTRGRARKGRLQ